MENNEDDKIPCIQMMNIGHVDSVTSLSIERTFTRSLAEVGWMNG